MRDLRKPPALWLFSLLILPLGVVVVGFNFTAFPLLLASPYATSRVFPDVANRSTNEVCN